MSDERIRLPRWISAVLVVATLGITVWLIARDRPSLEALRDIGPAELAIIMVLQLLYLVSESYRQEIVIESSSKRSISSFPWFRIFVVGRFLNALVPQGGNVYRALRLRSDLGIAISDFGGGMAAFVVMSVVASLVVAAPFLAWQSPSLTILGVPASLMVLMAGLLLAVIPFIAWRLIRDRIPADGEPPAILGIMHRIALAMMTALRDRRLLAGFAGTWSVTVIVVVMLYRAVFETVGWDLGIGEAIAIYALLQASSFIVLTPGNLGIQELGMAVLAALVGIPAATGAIAAAVIRVTGWIAVAVPAVAFGTTDIAQFLRTRPSS